MPQNLGDAINLPCRHLRPSPLPFHHLSEATQSALLKDPKVLAAHAKRGKECHGVTTGDVTLACERADHALADAIVGYIRAGGALPPPAKLPGG